MWNDTDGDPKDEDNEGGGTEGYDSVRETDPKVTGGLDRNDPDEGGVVACVSLLMKLVGLVDTAGENKNGPSEEGECDNGVFPPDGMAIGRWTCDVGRGMGTLCVGRECGMYITDDGDDEALEIGLEMARWCVGCESGSGEGNPMRLSTDSPSFKRVNQVTWGAQDAQALTLRLCSINSSRYTSFSRVMRM